MTKRVDIEVRGCQLTVLVDGSKYEVCERGNGDGLLFTCPFDDGLERVTSMATYFLLGRQRGQREGRNEVRSQIGNIINNVEAV